MQHKFKVRGDDGTTSLLTIPSEAVRDITGIWSRKLLGQISADSTGGNIFC